MHGKGKCQLLSRSRSSVLKSFKRFDGLGIRMYVVLLVGVCLVSVSECQSNLNSTSDNVVMKNVPSHNASLSFKSSINNAGSSEEDYYDDYEGLNSTGKGRWREDDDSSKLAQVVVYLVVIFIALVGVLIKYFVTQYETSQIKAQEQLSYHRLHNQLT